MLALLDSATTNNKRVESRWRESVILLSIIPYYMKWLVYLYCIILFSSCVSLKQTKQTGIKKVKDLTDFNGVYENASEDNKPAQFSSLWNQLKMNNDGDSTNFEQATIALEAVNNKQIKAVWWLGKQQKAEITLNGKLKDNYFVSKHKRTIIPIPFIFGKIKNNQFQLAISDNNTLLVDRLNNQWGWVVFFLASNDRTNSYEYRNSVK